MGQAKRERQALSVLEKALAAHPRPQPGSDRGIFLADGFLDQVPPGGGTVNRAGIHRMACVPPPANLSTGHGID
jgi:hypothetical protein